MFGYYFYLALRSLYRTPALTALMVLAIGVGIGTSMTTLAIFRTAAGDPIPRNSTQLFTPQIQSCSACQYDPRSAPSDGLPFMLTYQDAMGLMRLPTHEAQAAMYASVVALTPPDERSPPVQLLARATYSGFFPMFDVPFQYGGPWTVREDKAHAAVVVITRALNDQLFGGQNSVGRTLRIDTELSRGSMGRPEPGDQLITTSDYRLVGVIDRWQPVPRFYDLFPDASGNMDSLFIPFTRAIDARAMPVSVATCSGSPGKLVSFMDVWNNLLNGCNWVQFWVHLGSAAQVQHYRQTLIGYADEQRREGRFDWPSRVQLRDVPQWLSYVHVVPGNVRVALVIAFALLAACLVNAMSLIVARFLPHTRDIGIRRISGATRAAVFLQNLLELGVLGALGAGLGLALMALGLQLSRVLMPPAQVDLIRFDGADAVIAIVLSIVGTLLAGLYPVWRTTLVQSAFQHKGP